VNYFKILNNKIINVIDKSNNDIIKIEIQYYNKNNVVGKLLIGKLINGKLDEGSSLYNAIINFRKKFFTKEKSIVKNKANMEFFKQWVDKDITLLAYKDSETNTFKYYDWYITFDKNAVGQILKKFNKAVEKKIINFDLKKLENNNGNKDNKQKETN